MFFTRGFTFTHQAVREWEERFAPLLTKRLRLDIVAECATLEPCTRQMQPGVRVIVRHLLPVPVEEPEDDELSYWLDSHEEPEDDEPDTIIIAEGIGVLRVIKGRRGRT